MTENVLTLAQKIAKAGNAVGGKLKADKRNQEQRYDYISADKILSECGQALFQQGVSVVPSIVAHEIAAVERQGKNPRLDATVEMMMKVSDGVDAFEEPWLGMGSDYMTPDKALYKAITSGHRYFLAKLLCIGEGNEDAEHDTPEPEPAQARPNGSKPTPAPAPVSANAENAPATVKPRFTPAELREKLYARAAKTAGKAQSETSQSVAATLEGVLGGTDQRHEFIRWLTGGETESLKDLDDGMLLSLHAWLDPKYNRAAKVFECASPEARVEATAAHREYLSANGAQGELL